MRAHIGEPHVDVADPLRVRRSFGFVQQARAFEIVRQNPIDQGDVAARCFLADVAESRRLRPSHGATVRRDFAVDEPQQRRLARAVASDQTDLMALWNSRRRTIEDRPTFDPVCQIIDV
jgi:hypothetical protein